MHECKILITFLCYEWVHHKQYHGRAFVLLFLYGAWNSQRSDWQASRLQQYKCRIIVLWFPLMVICILLSSWCARVQRSNYVNRIISTLQLCPSLSLLLFIIFGLLSECVPLLLPLTFVASSTTMICEAHSNVFASNNNSGCNISVTLSDGTFEDAQITRGDISPKKYVINVN